MRALLIGDIHLGPPPSLRTDTYAQDILDKLFFCMEYANENNIDVVVLLGDVFHLKTASKTSHALVQATAAVLRYFNGRVLIVPGNHDLSQDRLESLPKQPLGTLALSPNVELIDGWDAETEIYGIPYLDDFDEFQRRLLDGIRQVDAVSIFVTHASVFPPNVHPPYPHMNADNLITSGYPIAYGHIHDPHGFYYASGSWFCNNGAISRGSLHEETLKREPKVTVFDSDATGCPFVSIPVPFKPYKQVFRLDEYEEKKETQARLDGFLETLEGTNLTSLSIEQVLQSATLSDLSTQAKAELAEIIEEATHSS